MNYLARMSTTPVTPDPALPFLLAKNSRVRPRSYPRLRDLAKAIHRRRGRRPINVFDAEMDCPGEAEPRKVAAIQLLNAEQQPIGFIGFAWLDGQPARVLRDALRTVQ